MVKNSGDAVVLLLFMNFHSVVFHCIQEAVDLGLGRRVNKE